MTARSRLALCLPALLALLPLSACSPAEGPGEDPAAGPAPSSASASPSPVVAVPPRPAERACRRLSYAAAVAPTNDAEPTSCAAPHTTQTFVVGRLRPVAAGQRLAVESALVQQQVADTCPRRLAGFVGGTQEDLRLSMLRSVWFTPTTAEAGAGASWFRCDVLAVDREGRLARVRGRLDGVLDTPEGRETYGMCGTAEPGAADFERTVCRDPHSWRAIGTVDLVDGRPRAPYPGVQRVREAGQEICDDQGRAVADDALDYQWGYEWPTAQQWSAGQTYGRCWAPDPA